MANLNTIPKDTVRATLGIYGGTIDMDLLQGAILIPHGKVYTPAELNAFKATLQAQAINDADASRAHILGRFKEIDDQSEDKQEKTWGYGDKTVTRSEVYKWSFPLLEGGFVLLRQLLKFKNLQSKYDVLFVDKSKQIWGTEAADTNGVPGLGGISMSQLWVDNLKPPTGSETPMYKVSFSISDAKQLNEKGAFIVVDFDVFSEIDQIIQLDLRPVGTTAVVDSDGDINIAVYSGGVNMCDALPSLIATGCFDVLNKTTGADVTITAVTIAGVGDGKYAAFNLDDTDTDYPAADGEIVLKTKSVSTVQGVCGEYLESNELTLVVS